MKKVAIIMGSDSDWPVVKSACTVLKEFGVPYEAHILSAHRTPEAAATGEGPHSRRGCRELLPANTAQTPSFVRALPGTSFGQRLASVKVTRLYIKIALTGSSSGGAAAGSLQKSAPSGWTGRFLGDTSYRQAL